MNKRCFIIGSAPHSDISEGVKQIEPNDFVVCADGGYLFAQKQGITPDLIVGDFDSSPVPQNFTGEMIQLPVMKDDTDTMYCLKECMKRGYRDFVLLGMTGGREDHTYANLCTLMYAFKHGARAKLTDGKSEIFLAENECVRISDKKGCTFSVFPFGCGQCTVSLKGFLYGLTEGTLEASFPLGVSNEVTSDLAEVTVSDGTALIFLCPKE